MRYTHPTQIPRSEYFKELVWRGERIPCSEPRHRGDTHPVAWADNDELYIGTGDPTWYELQGEPHNPGDIENPDDELKEYIYRRISGLAVESLTGEAEHFDIRRENDMLAYVGGGGSGPKPTGMICVDGVLYYAIQNMLGWKEPRHGILCQHGSDATILMSRDHGKTWEPDLDDRLNAFWNREYDRTQPHPRAWKTPAEQRTNLDGWIPMFPGNRFGGPSFVQFGKNNEDAVDEYVYAVSADQWDNGSELRLGRVAADRIMDRSAWEFAIPKPDGTVCWTDHLSLAEPILAIERHVSVPEMFYMPKDKKYILLTWSLHEDFSERGGSELTVLESDSPWGPFRLVHYEWMWYRREACCYCPRVPLKWFDQDKRIGYLLHSGNWITQNPYYKPQIRKFELLV